MKTSRYKIFESDDNQYQFKLCAKNGRTILTSMKHSTMEATLNTIKKVFHYGTDMLNFDMLEDNNHLLYFDITENDDRVIATSNLYKSEQSLIKACNSVMDNCQTEHISYRLGNKNENTN
jgi:uncharacterized protein YegP (UPF0339 family)